MIKHTNEDGTEVEVYTAEEVQARETAAVTAKEAEFGTIKTKLETDLADVTKALNERTGEFKQFRKLNDEAVAKLSVAERTIYENGLIMQEERERNAKTEADRKTALVDSALRARAGTDDKLFQKLKDTYSIIGIEANTPEEVEKKVLMTLGALQTTQPDLVATVVGFSSGGFLPPNQQQEEQKSFADSERGKAGAAELGLMTEAPKKA